MDLPLFGGEDTFFFEARSPIFLESGCFEDKALDGFGEVFFGFTCFAGLVFFLITDCWEMLFLEVFF